MAPGVFLLQGDDELVELNETEYVTEALLQELLAKYPALLVGDQVDSSAPRKWILVAREMGLGDSEGSGSRWSLDHLFLDQDGVPTIVEVKRSSDTRIRREVVGQMLDYAANAVVYLPVDQIRARFEESCRSMKNEPDEVLEGMIGESCPSDDYWARVKTNLQAGRIRLIFVADVIHPELRRIVEFLNGQMDPAEVLAIEIRQFTAGKMRTLVPRVIGQTAEAEKKKPRAAGEQWTEERFFRELEGRCGRDVVGAARRLLQWGREHTDDWIAWGSGKKDGSFIPVFEDAEGTRHYPFAVWTYGRLEFQFQYLKNKAPFDEGRVRQEFLKRLNAVPGVSLPANSIERRPAIPLAVLKPPAAMAQLLSALEWCATQVRGKR